MMEDIEFKSQQKEFFTVDSLANYLGCSSQLVRKYIKESNIPYFKIGTKFFFRKSSIDKFFEEQESSFSKERKENFQDIIRRLNE